MKLLTDIEIELAIQHFKLIKKSMNDGKIAKSEKEVKSGLPKLVFSERTADEFLEFLFMSKYYKSLVEEMQKALEWYADEENYFLSDGHQLTSVEKDCGFNARQALKGATP